MRTATLFAGLAGICTGCCAGTPQSAAVDAAYLQARHIPPKGDLISAKRVQDQSGEHILVLSRKAGPSPGAPRSGRIEHIELQAAYHSQQNGAWREDWTVRDMVDCPGLDAAANFFPAAVSISDVNQDGKAEVTIPYRLFCGGGIDSYTVKVILREGALKLAIRGESEVRLPGQAPFGGEHQYDKLLQTPAYAAYKAHMDQIWKTVSLDIRQ